MWWTQRVQLAKRQGTLTRTAPRPKESALEVGNSSESEDFFRCSTHSEAGNSSRGLKWFSYQELFSAGSWLVKGLNL